MEGFQTLLYTFHDLRNFSQNFFIVIRQLTPFRYPVGKILLRQHQRTVNEVSIDSHQLAIIPSLEIFPGKVVIFSFRSVCRQHVT